MVTTTCYIILGDECPKKEKKRERRKERIRGNKKGQVPGTSKKEKVRREVKMDKCPTVELGVQDTHLRENKKKRKLEHLIPLKKFQKSKKGMYPLKRAQIELDFHQCFHHYYHHHHTPFIRHTCTS